MARLIADAGLLVAADRNERQAWILKKLAAAGHAEVVVPAPVLAQCWRGAGSANLARFLKGVRVIAFDDVLARDAGTLLGVSATVDVVDAAVVVSARDGDLIVTGDSEDIARLVECHSIAVEVRSLRR